MRLNSLIWSAKLRNRTKTIHGLNGLLMFNAPKRVESQKKNSFSLQSWAFFSWLNFFVHNRVLNLFTHNSNFFICNSSFLVYNPNYGKMYLRNTSTNHEQRSSIANKKAPIVSKKTHTKNENHKTFKGPTTIFFIPRDVYNDNIAKSSVLVSWGITQLSRDMLYKKVSHKCICVELMPKRVSHHFGQPPTSKKCRAIWALWPSKRKRKIATF